jgi:pyrimidine deaminase RibD-like protein
MVETLDEATVMSAAMTTLEQLEPCCQEPSNSTCSMTFLSTARASRRR